MVISVRVDDRLIHGQVALVWTKELNTPGIIVANDHAEKDDVLRMTLQMAVPTGKKLLVKSVENSVRVINDPRGKDMRIFALTNCVKDVLRLVENCAGNIQSVNIANVGRFDKSDKSTQVQLNSTIMLNLEELEAARKLVTMGIPVYHQLIPENKQVPIVELLKNVKC